MERQLQANTLRIEVLQRENAQLQALLAKVKAAAEQGVLKVSWVLWQGAVYPKNSLWLPDILWGPQEGQAQAPHAAVRSLWFNWCCLRCPGLVPTPFLHCGHCATSCGG